MDDGRPGDVRRLAHTLFAAGGRTHQQIADEIRRRLPHAKTTAKSVASMAVSYRRQVGQPLPPRTAPAGTSERNAAVPVRVTSPDPRLSALHALIAAVKRNAIDYYELTGRPLGVTGEIGEYEAAKHLGLHLAAAREPGYDALDGAGVRYQIKARSWDEQASRRSQRMGAIKLDHDWDAVLLVLLGRDLEPTSMWRADRPAVEAALTAPGSKARTERGALAVSKFKSIGGRIWSKPISVDAATQPQAALMTFEEWDTPEDAAAFDVL